jgi:hypothetical protein
LPFFGTTESIKSKANDSQKKESINKNKSAVKYISNSGSIKMLRMVIWFFCMFFCHDYALNIGETKHFPRNNSNGE